MPGIIQTVSPPSVLLAPNVLYLLFPSLLTALSSVYSSNWADLDPVPGPLCPLGAWGIICLYEVFSYWAVITITDLVITLMTGTRCGLM